MASVYYALVSSICCFALVSIVSGRTVDLGDTDVILPQGVVNFTRCGGVGTPVQMRITNCTGNTCDFIPGNVYECEMDFYPSSSIPSLTLWVDLCRLGTCTGVIDIVLPNSSVQPGFIYTAKYNLVPNDILKGERVELIAHLVHTGGELIEICGAIVGNIV